MAVEYEYISIEKELVPYCFHITLNEKTFTFDVNYNAEHDFFTVDLYRDNELIVASEKIVYGRVLFDCQQYANIPDTYIIPYDMAQNETRVSWDNLGETVFLWVVNGDG